ncbi:hypothetical protein J6590_059219 [Homalodisca vitripennis]|nr:hypothetical protein J6590_059219 [Homalodisca vitripennis]
MRIEQNNATSALLRDPCSFVYQLDVMLGMECQTELYLLGFAQRITTRLTALHPFSGRFNLFPPPIIFNNSIAFSKEIGMISASIMAG